MKWNDSLSVGNILIDNQHQELISRYNNLLDACNQRMGKQEIGKTLDFLGEYVSLHFNYEEEQMLKVNYPELLSHKKQHDEFILRYIALKEEYEQGKQIGVIIRANKMLSDWLINHIGTVDKKLGGFLKSSS